MRRKKSTRSKASEVSYRLTENRVDFVARKEGPLFDTHPDRLWDPPSFPGKHSSRGREVNHTLPSSSEVKKYVELFFYSPIHPHIVARN
jgi:hypothetical protein